MELFPDRTHVRLRSIGAATYLHADEDGRGVSYSHHRASLNTAWVVDHLTDTGVTYVLLHSAAYGRYLGVRNDAPQELHPAVRIRMVQCFYRTPLQADIMWQVFDGNGTVLLRPRIYPGAIHPFAFHFTVEAIPLRPTPPQIPGQIPNGAFAPVALRRMIRYGWVDRRADRRILSVGMLQFDGRSLHCLIGDLAYRLNESYNNITLCVKAGFLGRVTPLVVDLPLSEDMMYIVVYTTGSAAATRLQHPDVDAA